MKLILGVLVLGLSLVVATASSYAARRSPMTSSIACGSTPTLDFSTCGTGATITGDECFGKITLGTNNGQECLVTFPTSAGHACVGDNETMGGSQPSPVGAVTTSTTADFLARLPWTDGDVITYNCPLY